MTKIFNGKKLPPLKALRGFEAAARKQSIRGAAEELNVTHPAISHQIKVLEGHYGVPLFQQQGRSVTLSEQGKTLYPFVLNALSQLANGYDAIHTQPEAPLRVQTYVTASIRWLGQRLFYFERQHPDINLHLTTCSSGWSFDENSADIGILYCAEEPPPHLRWIPLFRYRIFPVCSPRLIAHYRQPLQPKDLLKLPLTTVYTEEQYWEKWFLSAGIKMEIKESPIRVDTLAIALEMALKGRGVALINGPFANDEIAEKRLVIPTDHQNIFPGHWGIVFRKDIENETRVQTFIKWLQNDSKKINY